MIEPEDRFWLSVKKTPDGCWEWLGALSNGYGELKYSGMRSPVLAHRFSWELVNGPVPGDLCVLHLCDNPRCVRPDHLFLGDRTDNHNDMVQKGRQARGAALPHAKLAGLADEIRSSYATGGTTYQALADEHGVSPSAIARIINGTAYREPERVQSPGAAATDETEKRDPT
jgi:hypothetical protein